jgi:uncharacterized protein YkwD
VSLARGRITELRHAPSPDEGSDGLQHRSYRAQVPFASAAAPARIALTAALFAALAALVCASSADGGGRAWNAYLAPAAACKGSTDPAAPAAVQQRAVVCLVNWARRQDSRARLSQSSSLQRAAGLKGKKVVSCGQLSHTPCGSGLTAPLTQAGYRYASFGENLFVGTWGSVSARDVVAAWLQSSGHRANVLRPYFRDVGAAFVRADGLLNDGPEVVWIATFGSRR